MPYVLVSTQIRLDNGPTIVGDEHSDTDLMLLLGARKRREPGSFFDMYIVDDPPRVVLNKLENLGYKVVGTSGVGQTFVWTLHITLVKGGDDICL